jgi:hypothetical protein
MIGKETRQKEMYVVINYQATAKCLPISEEAEGDDSELGNAAGGSK